MAECFLVQNGGGNSLNFKVVGNPQPASPKENTIWVDTDAKITGWIFSASQPENPAEGMVWFNTGSFGTASFNALKKNGIQVYPESAKQYVGGAWVDVTAKTYQSGQWVDWYNGELFSYGNEYTDITGGWVQRGGNIGSGTYGGTMTIVTNANGGYDLTADANWSHWHTVNAIDLTDVKQIEFTGSLTSSAYPYYAVFAVHSDVTNTNLAMNVVARMEANLEYGVHLLNVEGIDDGSYYIGIYLGGNRSAVVDEIRLIRG